MASHFNNQSQDEAGSYASLPGSGSRGFVSHNMTDVKLRAASLKEPGCHPSRWIYELINNDFTTCDMFNRARSIALDVPFDWEHTHRLVVNGNQSFATDHRKVVSSVCLDCHFHFVFKIFWDASHTHELCQASRATWPMREDIYPWHHLAWAGSEPDHIVSAEHSHYYPLQAREHFACVAPPCTFQVTLDVSTPRLGSRWVNILQDGETILRELEKARKQEPERYQTATDEWSRQAPINLNTYLKDLLEGSEPRTKRSISKRNKRFAVVFGARSYPLFKELGFDEAVDIHDGVDHGSFTPAYPMPSPNDDGHTDIGSYRGYIEDVRNEVQALIYRTGQAPEQPSFISTSLHASLGCTEVPSVNGNALVNLERYRLLGVLPNQPAEAVANAYFRQWELLPGKRQQLIDSLMHVAVDCGDEGLSHFAMTQSSLFDSQLEVQGSTDDDGVVNEALIFLGLGPPNKYPVDAIVEAFRKKLREQPADASTAREMLMQIAQSSKDDNYQTNLLIEAGKLSLATAKYVLGIKDSEPEVAWLKYGEDLLEKTSEPAERSFFVEAYATLAEHANLGAIATKAQHLREKYLGQMPLPEEPLGDQTLPVGLNNIGNTCYLNSLLQYLYTVRAVREIVTNYEAFQLDLSDDSIQKRRLGGNKMEMDRGEAVVAQAFVQELAELFHMLRTSDKKATRPSQRLANAVLLSTRRLLEDTKTDPAPTPVEMTPPPLPARPSLVEREAPPSPPSSTPSLLPSDAATPSDFTLSSESHSITSRRSSSTLIDADEDTLPRLAAMEDSPAVSAEKSVMQVDAKMLDASISGDGIQKVTDEEPAKVDVSMVDVADESQEIDRKVLRALEHQTRSSGTDQQDVEEVIGSIISLLQAAIRPSHVDGPTGIQYEKIIETFFVTTVNYTKKFGERDYQHEISYDRSITAFPAPEGRCSLYDALGQNFDQQVLEESNLSRYTAIKILPPILHVLIQRTQSAGTKNDNPVIIPETLYLDRYMDAPHDSPEFERRKRDWVLSSRLGDLRKLEMEAGSADDYGALLERAGQGRQVGAEDGEVQGEGADDAMAVDTLEEVDTSQEEDWSFDGPVDDDYVLISKERSEGRAKAQIKDQEQGPEGIAEVEQRVLQMISEEIKEREQALDEDYNRSQEHPYQLEAVICHRGRLSSGHYWVWIRDFEDGVWRCYNDGEVGVETDTEKVLRDLSTGGEPYYLCYVRDKDKEELVSVPKRECVSS